MNISVVNCTALAPINAPLQDQNFSRTEMSILLYRNLYATETKLDYSSMFSIGYTKLLLHNWSYYLNNFMTDPITFTTSWLILIRYPITLSYYIILLHYPNTLSYFIIVLHYLITLSYYIILLHYHNTLSYYIILLHHLITFFGKINLSHYACCDNSTKGWRCCCWVRVASFKSNYC